MLASDVVMAVLVHMPHRHFEGTPLQIHAAFRKLASQPPYQDLFDGFTFGRPGAPVSSYAVEVAWDNLATAGMLSTSNPRLVRHELDEVADDYFESRLRNEFDAEGFDEDFLRAVANAFMESLTAVRENPQREDLLILG